MNPRSKAVIESSAVVDGTTWLADGAWAPDGLYSRFIWPAIGMVAVVVASRVLARAPSTHTEF